MKMETSVAIETSQELRMLSRSLSYCKSLTSNVMIQVSQFVNCHIRPEDNFCSPEISKDSVLVNGWILSAISEHVNS